MDSSLVRKIEKAKDYAMQPSRVTFTQHKANFRGNNGNYTIAYQAGQWHCSCPYFAGHEICSHTMATKLILSGPVSKEAASLQ